MDINVRIHSGSIFPKGVPIISSNYRSFQEKKNKDINIFLLNIDVTINNLPSYLIIKFCEQNSRNEIKNINKNVNITGITG